MSVLFTRRGTPPEGGISGGSGGGETVSGTLASDLEIGSSVKLKVNGSIKEFLIVHQGKPSSMYDSSCDGTWLLMKDVYETRVWDESNVSDYAASDIHPYLNGDFLGLFDADMQSTIQAVKIPYFNGNGLNGSVLSGSSGLDAKIFLLSCYEMGWTQSQNGNMPATGACLSYFAGTSKVDSKRIGLLNGSAVNWWLRDPNLAYSNYTWNVYNTGDWNGNQSASNLGIRPALILPSNAVFDPTTKEFLGVADNSGSSGQPEDTTCTITVTGTSVYHSGTGSYCCYAIIDGTTITAPCTIEVEKGTVIKAFGESGIILDGVRGTDNKLNDYTVDKDVTILLDSYAIQIYATT